MITPYTTSPASYSLNQSERALLGFSLRLHLMHRSLLRASLRPTDAAPGWSASPAEAIRDLHQEFMAMTEGRLKHPFAAMHGQEMRRWESHLAAIIRSSALSDGLSSDLLDELEGIVRSGEDLLPFLRNGSAKEVAVMLSHFRRALTRLKASEPKSMTTIDFPQTDTGLCADDWDRVLTSIWNAQSGEFSPVKRGSWRCLETAIREAAGVLPIARKIPRPLVARAGA